jgi:sortase (surface protein transpeptidase)
VIKKMVVQPTDTWIADQDGTDHLTLSTCHPKGSAKQRLVIVAELVK